MSIVDELQELRKDVTTVLENQATIMQMAAENEEATNRKLQEAISERDRLFQSSPQTSVGYNDSARWFRETLESIREGYREADQPLAVGDGDEGHKGARQANNLYRSIDKYV